jgi:hypothetical protein
MPITNAIRATFFFEDDQFGISETHDYQTGGALDTAVAPAIALLKKRMKLMGFGVTIVGVRLSKEGVFRDSLVLDPTDWAGIAPPAFNYSGPAGNAGTNDPDQAKACVLVRAESSSLHRKSIYLSGIPDIIIREDPRGPALTQVPQWLSDFNAYANELIVQPWGFIGRSDPAGALAQFPIAGIVTQAGTGLIGIVVANALITYPVLQFVAIHGSTRTHPAYASLNGRWQIGSAEAGPGVGFTTYFLLNSQNVAAPTVINRGTVQAVDFSFLKYTRAQIIGQTTRKRGNRFLAPPGRRTIRRPLPV